MAPGRDQAKFYLAKGEAAPELVLPHIADRKAMLILAMDFHGIAFWHLCNEKQNVNGQVYRDFLAAHINEWMARKRIKKPILLQDGASCHRSKLVKEFLNENNIDTWVHPPYSPDNHPCDFNAFNPLKRELKTKSYKNFHELKTAIINAIS